MLLLDHVLKEEAGCSSHELAHEHGLYEPALTMQMTAALERLMGNKTEGIGALDDLLGHTLT